MKKLISAALVALLLLGIFAFTGCDYTEIDAEALGNKVLATVNGEEILRKEWSDLYDYYEYIYINYYGYSKESNPKIFEELKTNVLDSLINSKIWEQKANAAGYFEYTQEQKDEAKKEVEEEIEETIKTNADSLYDAVKDQDDAEEYEHYYEAAKEKYYDDLEKSGVTVEDKINDKLKEKALDRYKEDHLKDVDVLEADILSAYDELVKEQKEDFIGEDEKDYAAFVKAWNNGDNMAVILDGYCLVQHILIKFDTKLGTEVTNTAKTLKTKKTELDKLKTELEKLTDEDKKAEKQKEIDAKQKEVDEAQTAYDAARKAAEEDLRQEAQEVLDSVKGADEAKFIEIMLEKTEDTGMNTQEKAEKGYLVGNEDGLMTEFHDGALALTEEGEISGLVATDYGFHIIRKIKDVQERTDSNIVKYSELKDALKEDLLTTAKNDQWSADQEEWYKAATIKINKEWLKDYDV